MRILRTEPRVAQGATNEDCRRSRVVAASGTADDNLVSEQDTGSCKSEARRSTIEARRRKKQPPSVDGVKKSGTQYIPRRAVQRRQRRLHTRCV